MGTGEDNEEAFRLDQGQQEAVEGTHNIGVSQSDVRHETRPLWLRVKSVTGKKAGGRDSGQPVQSGGRRLRPGQQLCG